MITTNDAGLAEQIRRFNSLGYAAVGAAAGKGKITREMIQDPAYERHASVGWNYRLPELCAAVALAQTERLQELVAVRVRAARLYAEAARGCAWLAPQAVPDGYGHAYWTYVLKLENGGAFTWYDFRAKYRELGGDGIYAAWQLTYLEPAFRGRRFTPQAAPGRDSLGRCAEPTNRASAPWPNRCSPSCCSSRPTTGTRPPPNVRPMSWRGRSLTSGTRSDLLKRNNQDHAQRSGAFSDGG